MKKSNKKLQLTTVTVRQLQTNELAKVQGGVRATPPEPPTLDPFLC
jgi:bacteriocin-like protein